MKCLPHYRLAIERVHRRRDAALFARERFEREVGR
jgi:hypothetical protein